MRRLFAGVNAGLPGLPARCARRSPVQTAAVGTRSPDARSGSRLPHRRVSTGPAAPAAGRPRRVNVRAGAPAGTSDPGHDGPSRGSARGHCQQRLKPRRARPHRDRAPPRGRRLPARRRLLRRGDGPARADQRRVDRRLHGARIATRAPAPGGPEPGPRLRAWTGAGAPGAGRARARQHEPSLVGCDLGTAVGRRQFVELERHHAATS